MKGITHFMSGVAVASCFPQALDAIFASRGLLLPLGGVFGVMPDTLDFRIARYVWNYQRVCRIDEGNLDPRVAAEAMAQAIDDAARTGDLITLRLDVIRVSSSYYRTYLVYVDDQAKEVTAVIGSLKTMSQVMEKSEFMPSSASVRQRIQKNGPAQTFKELFESLPGLPGSTPGENYSYTAKFTADIQNTYYQETEVGIFSGPDFAFDVGPDGKVRIDFIPWHRTWSHSLLMGLFMGPVAFLVTAKSSLLFSGQILAYLASGTPAAFFIAVIAFWVHCFEDQTGHLGSNLLWPFTAKRTPGLKWTTAASPVSNIGTNWLAFSTIIWNVNAHAPEPAFTLPWAWNLPGGFADWTYYLSSLGVYVLLAIVIPYSAFFVLSRFYRSFKNEPGMMNRYGDGNTFEMAGFAADEGDL